MEGDAPLSLMGDPIQKKPQQPQQPQAPQQPQQQQPQQPSNDDLYIRTRDPSKPYTAEGGGTFDMSNPWNYGNPYLSGYMYNESIPLAERQAYMREWAASQIHRPNVQIGTNNPDMQTTQGYYLPYEGDIDPRVAQYLAGDINAQGQSTIFPRMRPLPVTPQPGNSYDPNIPMGPEGTVPPNGRLIAQYPDVDIYQMPDGSYVRVPKPKGPLPVGPAGAEAPIVPVGKQSTAPSGEPRITRGANEKSGTGGTPTLGANTPSPNIYGNSKPSGTPTLGTNTPSPNITNNKPPSSTPTLGPQVPVEGPAEPSITGQPVLPQNNPINNALNSLINNKVGG